MASTSTRSAAVDPTVRTVSFVCRSVYCTHDPTDTATTIRTAMATRAGRTDARPRRRSEGAGEGGAMVTPRGGRAEGWSRPAPGADLAPGR
ncbi:hypothetical protein AB0G81_09805 [Streptomyces asoensis]|uniref:hypothetical protein n=1 Tax=Streptomyces asoensis TaxID=249586 RepID=UPI003410FC5A